MGIFLSMSGVLGGEVSAVESALRDFAMTHHGDLRAEALPPEHEFCMVLAPTDGGVSIAYPAEFFDWDEASQFLSKAVGKPVFSLHIHDDDLWMYILYSKGTAIDHYNPIPNYWNNLDLSNMQTWRGNANVVAQSVPGLDPAAIEKYLVRWDLDAEEDGKAYPDDEFEIANPWQMMDFLKKLRLAYPIDEQGNALGPTYFFKCGSMQEG